MFSREVSFFSPSYSMMYTTMEKVMAAVICYNMETSDSKSYYLNMYYFSYEDSQD